MIYSPSPPEQLFTILLCIMCISVKTVCLIGSKEIPHCPKYIHIHFEYIDVVVWRSRGGWPSNGKSISGRLGERGGGMIQYVISYGSVDIGGLMMHKE